MASGVPVRLSVALAARARATARLLDRSLTDQVEHWARLGQVVEAVISAGTMQRLKARSHDPELAERLAVAATAQGRAKAAKLIRERNPIRHGIGAGGAPRRVQGRKRPTLPNTR